MALPSAVRRSRRARTDPDRLSWARVTTLVLEEARPVVQLMYLLRFVVGWTLVDRDQVLTWRAAAATSSWLLATVVVYTLNGITDHGEDVGNGSSRPIARGELPPRLAGTACVLAAVGSLVFSAPERSTLPWLLLFLVLGCLYSAGPMPAKSWTESAAVVIFGLGWASYFAGSAAAGVDHHDVAVAVIAGTGSAWMALVGAVLKDLSDLTGDANGGRRTLAIRYGPLKAQQIGCGGALLVGLGGVAASFAWAPIVVPGAVVYLVGALWLLSPRGTSPGTTTVENREAWRRSYRVFMVTQYGANASVLAALLAGVGG